MSSANTFDTEYETAVAVIGVAGRFPGSKDIDEFWQNLKNGVESISFFSDRELETAGVDLDLLRNPRYIKARAILEGIALFDAAFFDISPKQAELIDPQQRLFLECAWEALECAGYNPESYTGRIGVYAGVGMNTYLFNLYSNPELIATVGGFQAMINNDKDYLSTRVSYKLNLKGPSVTVQSACSTSLVAVHLAWQSLLAGESDMALAGGVSILLPQSSGYMHQEGMILSPDGHCRAFDARAKGTVPGSGVGVVMLKRLAEALADGDTIYAIIRGSAINNDGSAKGGYTAPSEIGQAEVITEALAIAGVEAETITYVEAHGTGTELGDPIEIAALTQAFQTQTQKKNYCAIGSVKTNIGHLDIAAGCAGLIKTILSLGHRQIPPSLHFEQANPKIDFVNSPFFVNTTLKPWKTNGAPRRAGVSSFGIGGTNVHLILEEAPPVEPCGGARGGYLLPISAASGAALDVAVANLAHYLKHHPDTHLGDIAYTLQVGRKAQAHRRIVVCHNREEAVAALENADGRRVSTSSQAPRRRPVVFMFSGQGSQYVNMALELYQSEPVFQEHLERCAQLLQPLLKLDLLSLLYPSQAQAEASRSQIAQTWLTQPVLFIVEYALAQLWMAWGVRPEAMIGHSIGEYVAACLAGVFSLEDALTLVAIRGRLMQGLHGGAMISVRLSEKDLQPFLGEKLSVAAVNGPSLCVVSGPEDSVEIVERQLARMDLAYRRLHTSHAFHSSMMEPILAPFLEQVKQFRLNPPQIPYVSNLTGTWITAAEATDPSYWVEHLRRPVRFGDGLQELLPEAAWLLLEVGPGDTLATLAKQHPHRTAGQIILASLPHAREQQPDRSFLLNALGQLWLAGVKVDWLGFNAPERRRRIPLPTYPFERKYYWIEPGSQPQGHLSASSGRSYTKPDVADWFYTSAWKPTPLPAPRRLNTEQGACWLVFDDGFGLGTQLIRHLSQAGHDSVRVEIGQSFVQLDQREFIVNPRRQDDYSEVFSALKALGKVPQRVIHLWAMTDNGASLEADFSGTTQQSAFYSLLFLAQALTSYLSEPVEAWIVTSNAQAIGGEPFLCPEKATIFGAAKAAQQQYPQLTCHTIDVVLPEAGTWQVERLTNQLMAEILASSCESLVAYRDHQRLVQVFERICPNRAHETTALLRSAGVYLIIGGLAGVGFATATCIAQIARVNLILVDQDTLPPMGQWEEWLSNTNDQANIRAKILNAQALRAMGTEVMVTRVDVSDQDQMKTLIAQIDERFGGLHGVIHALGNLNDAALVTAEAFDHIEYIRSVQEHISSLLVLEQVLLERVLDFCLLQSPLAAMLGYAGSAADVAVQYFKAAFAQRHNRRSLVPWTSVCWDRWDFEIIAGAPAETDSPGPAIASAEGLVAFRHLLLANGMNQVVISPGDLPARFEPRLAASRASLSVSPYSRPSLSRSYVAPRDALEESLAGIWQQLLGVHPIGIQDNFFELGGDSLILVQIISKVSQAGLPLTAKQLFENATIAELSAVAGTVEVIPIQAEQGIVTGAVPLTSIQLREIFDESVIISLHHNVDAFLLESRQPLNPEILKQVVQALLIHHDALRLRYVPAESGWQQFHAEPRDVPFSQIDLSSLPREKRKEALMSAGTALQTSLNLSAGPLIRFTLFDARDTDSSYLMIVLHNIVADGMTWRIVLEDFHTAYQQLSRGDSIQLPAKTTSFKRWAEWQAEYVTSTQLRQEAAYWLAAPRRSARRLPVDYPEGINSYGSRDRVLLELSVDETRALLHETPRIYHAQINDVMLTAALLAFKRWTGESSMLIDLVGNGREPRFEGLDLSRTAGWISWVYPMLFTLEDCSHPYEALKSMQRQKECVPNGGLGHGLLYCFGEADVVQQLRALPQAQADFSYWGQFTQTFGAIESLVQFDPEASTGDSRSPQVVMPRLIEIQSLIINDRLSVIWSYSKNVHCRSTIEYLAQTFLKVLHVFSTGDEIE